YETDEQRAEVLIDWLNRNAGYLLFLAGLVIGSIAGLQLYKRHHVSVLNAKLDRYESFLSLYGDEPIDGAVSEQLVASNEGIYQAFSAMLLAKAAHGASDFVTAEILLNSALTTADDEGLKALLQYRLAIVQFDQGKNEVALESLKQIQAVEFLGLRKVLEGDIYLSMGQIGRAH